MDETKGEAMTEITIDKNVPMPNRWSNSGRKPIYPWLTMEVGDSFLMPDHVKRPMEHVSKASRRYAPRRFASRTTPEGTRIWRVA